MKWAKISMWTLVLCGLLAPTALAQRGVGEGSGVARKADQPKVVVLKGSVLEVESGPCENTTGPSLLGTHFLLKAPKGKTLNIHLGPTRVVDFVAKELTKGKKVKVEAFRTEQMKKDHYVARRIECDGRAVTLRDETLRPAWAGGGRAASPQAWTSNRYGRGAGPGWGRGYGRGRGGGAGPGWGRATSPPGYGAATDQCPRFGAWYPIEEADERDE